MRGFWVLIVGFLAVSSGCSGQETSRGVGQKTDFAEMFSSAMTTDNPEEIKSAIEGIDNLIDSRDSEFVGLEYNKAQLLTRLGEDEEALSTIRTYDGSDRPVLEGTLLYRLDRRDEANALLNSAIDGFEESFFAGQIDSERMGVAASGIALLYALTDRDASHFFERVTDLGLLSEEELQHARTAAQLTKDEIVRSMWPTRIQRR